MDIKCCNTDNIHFSVVSSLELSCWPNMTTVRARQQNLVPMTALWKGSSLRGSTALVGSGRGAGLLVGILRAREGSILRGRKDLNKKILERNLFFVLYSESAVIFEEYLVLISLVFSNIYKTTPAALYTPFMTSLGT